MNRYEVVKAPFGKFHIRNMDTHETFCGVEDTMSMTVLENRNCTAVGTWVMLDGRDASCKTCEAAAKAEYLTTIKGA